jgi:hypothetical protein
MTTEEKVTIYLQGLVDLHEIEEFRLVGINGENATAKNISIMSESTIF